MLEGLSKYGWLFNIPNPIEIVSDIMSWPCLAVYVLLYLPFSLVYVVEVHLRRRLPGFCIVILHVALNSMTLIVPFAVVEHVSAHFLQAFILLNTALIFSMKQTSFAHVLSQSASDPSSRMVSISHYAFYALAPTMCFQYSYPRSNGIRWVWLSKRVGELVLGVLLMAVIIQQQMIPGLRSSMEIFEAESPSTLMIIERHLRVSVPNLYVWLLFFYIGFQVFLNIVAEMLRFGDRSFYQEWWNAHTLAEYWRLWNAPVHNWLVRHIYIPLRNRKVSSAWATFWVFFISGLAHEYVGSGCFHIRSCMGFLAIMLQVPMIYLTNFFEAQLRTSQLGNVFFWVVLIVVGQPIVLIIYSYAAIRQA